MARTGSSARQPPARTEVATAAATPVQSADSSDRWVVDLAPLDGRGRRACESIATVADASFGARGLTGLDGSVSWPALFASGVYTGDDIPELLAGPVWTTVKGRLDGPSTESLQVDLRHGIVRHRWQFDGHEIMVHRFLSGADVGVAVQRVDGPVDSVATTEPVVRPGPRPGTSVTSALVGTAEVMSVRDDRSGACIAVAAHDEVNDTSSSRSIVRLVGIAAGGGAGIQTMAADRLRRARSNGPAALERRHRSAWDRRWARCGTWMPDRPELERAVRFATFHLLCAGSTGSDPDGTVQTPSTETAIGARGVTGTSYRGHVFWDADVFVVPVLSAIAPAGARRSLDYRWARLGQARARAHREGRRGARFPWESAAAGTEVTPVSAHDLRGNLLAIRTGELEIHITADIAWAVGNHVDWTGDDEFLASHGLELLVETARYWTSRLEIDQDRSAHLRGVIGPDEYHEHVDDNVFTNVMVRHNLDLAAAAAVRFGGCDPTEIRTWQELSEALVVEPDESGIYEQFSGYHALDDLSVHDIGEPPLSADALLGHDVIAGTQIIKQPDVMMAYHLVPHLLDAGVFERNLARAIERTAHGSSLSPAISASLLFRARRWQEATDLLELAAFLDLDDVTGTTAGGLHLATMGGLWQAVTFGLLGLRATASGLVFDPHVPPELGPIRHRLMYRGTPIDVRVSDDRARVEGSVAVPLAVAGETRKACRHDVRRTGEGWEHR